MSIEKDDVRCPGCGLDKHAYEIHSLTNFEKECWNNFLNSPIADGYRKGLPINPTSLCLECCEKMFRQQILSVCFCCYKVCNQDSMTSIFELKFNREATQNRIKNIMQSEKTWKEAVNLLKEKSMDDEILLCPYCSIKWFEELKEEVDFADLFKNYNGSYECRECDTGAPVGKEIW